MPKFDKAKDVLDKLLSRGARGNLDALTDAAVELGEGSAGYIARQLERRAGGDHVGVLAATQKLLNGKGAKEDFARVAAFSIRTKAENKFHPAKPRANEEITAPHFPA